MAKRDPHPKRLLDRVRDALYLTDDSIYSAEADIDRITRYIPVHNERYPLARGTTETATFLAHLVVKGNVAASTHNQTLSVLLS